VPHNGLNLWHNVDIDVFTALDAITAMKQLCLLQVHFVLRLQTTDCLMYVCSKHKALELSDLSHIDTQLNSSD